MKVRLKRIIERKSKTLPVQWSSTKRNTNSKGCHNNLEEAVCLLHSISPNEKNKVFFEHVTQKDFQNVVLFLTEILWEVNNSQKK